MKQKRKAESWGITEKKCATCGKTLCRTSFDDYAWKINNKYFCSYGCMRAMERKMRLVR